MAESSIEALGAGGDGAVPKLSSSSLPPVFDEPDSSLPKSEVKIEAPENINAAKSFTLGSVIPIIKITACFPHWMEEMIYWRDPCVTGCTFASLVTLMVAFSLCSTISVVAYVSMAFLVASFTFVAFKKVVATLQKTGEAHPFQTWLDKDVAEIIRAAGLTDELVHNLIDTALMLIDHMRHLFLIADWAESAKFAAFAYFLSYVGAIFNLLTLAILMVVGAFTLPKIYEIYHEEIDAVAEKMLAVVKAQWPVLKKSVMAHVNIVKEKVISILPISKSKAS